MTKKQHLKFLKVAEWDDITEVMMDLEQQRHTLKDLLTKKQLKELDELIEIYDTHRAGVLSDISKKGGFNRTMNLEIQESMDMEPDIGGLDDGY